MSLSFAEAEGQFQRKWHKQLQSVLSWLLPQHSAVSHMPRRAQASETAADGRQSPQQDISLASNDAVKLEHTKLTPAASHNGKDIVIMHSQQRPLDHPRPAQDAEPTPHRQHAPSTSQLNGNGNFSGEQLNTSSTSQLDCSPARQPGSPGTTQLDNRFDAAELYAAVKPDGNEPELLEKSAKLKPTLRPYQKRAAAWMVARETGWQVYPLLMPACFFPNDEALATLKRLCRGPGLLEQLSHQHVLHSASASMTCFRQLSPFRPVCHATCIHCCFKMRHPTSQG